MLCREDKLLTHSAGIVRNVEGEEGCVQPYGKLLPPPGQREGEASAQTAALRQGGTQNILASLSSCTCTSSQGFPPAKSRGVGRQVSH